MINETAIQSVRDNHDIVAIDALRRAAGLDLHGAKVLVDSPGNNSPHP
jgi:hypothetical protein